MSRKQMLLQEIETLPVDTIDDVLQFIAYIKFKIKKPSTSDSRLNDFDNLVDMIHSAVDEPMPPIETIRFHEVKI